MDVTDVPWDILSHGENGYRMASAVLLDKGI